AALARGNDPRVVVSRDHRVLIVGRRLVERRLVDRNRLVIGARRGIGVAATDKVSAYETIRSVIADFAPASALEDLDWSAGRDRRDDRVARTRTGPHMDVAAHKSRCRLCST